MRWLVVLFLVARLAVAGPAQAERPLRPLETWGFWAALLMAQGSLGGLGAGSMLAIMDDRDVRLFAGSWLAFSIGAIVTAIGILVYRGQPFWAIDEYWQSRSPY